LPTKPIYATDLSFIAAEALLKEEENDHFLRSLRNQDDQTLDVIAHQLNDVVSTAIDCTKCGNCCKSLVINVTKEEVGMLAEHLHMLVEATKEKYIEESMQGNCFINTIPCHFLTDNKCTIYETRFTECRDFPHLHKPGFKARLSGTLMHYGRCPIIYNVVEEMKLHLGFVERGAY
jgi:uncharacterized protein